jgi:EAL domain-containing protein (putative c-di-GMP-specific phosphodiesterase class I)
VLEPRWLEPGGAEVAPARFLAALQQAGALGPLGDRAAAAAGAHLRALATSGTDVLISVGIVADHLHDASFADRATDGSEPSRLTFSLAEADFRASPGAGLGLLTRLRVKGCGVALEGFGAGHAPDDLVRALPLTEVRLAPSLVRAAVADDRQVTPLSDALDAARRLDVVVVGDGADDDATLELLLALGCDRLLGDRIAPAMPETELAGWTAAWDPSLLVVGGAP